MNIVEKITFFLKESDTNKSIGIFLGRFQPPHNGHLEIIKKVSKENTDGLVVVVEGAKSSQDKERNPFALNVRMKLVEEISPRNIKVTTYPSANIIGLFEDHPELAMYNSVNFYAGADRFPQYKRMMTKLSESYPNIKFDIKETPRVMSATEVRNLLKDNNYEEAQKRLPYSIKKLF